MAVQQHDIKPFVRGDNFAMPLRFQNKEGESMDLTGWTLWFTVKLHPEQPDEEALIQKQITVSDDNALVQLSSTDTEDMLAIRYHYDLQLVSPTKDVVQTLVIGRFTLLPGVTERTALPEASQ